MQTFLPYPSFLQSAQCLDRSRLGKQRVEVLQILKALSGESLGWRNHPAVKMWRNSEQALITYGILVCDEWTRRGYKDTCLLKIHKYNSKFLRNDYPSWMYNNEFHLAHQSNLIRKDPNYYRPIFGDSVPDNLDYIWPINQV